MHIITGLGTGGAERTLHSILAGGLGQEFDSYVVSLLDEGTFGQPIRHLGVHVSHLGIRHKISLLENLLTLRSVVNEFRPDVIQGWMYHGNLAASMAKIVSPRNPLVVWNVRHNLNSLSDERLQTRLLIRGSRALSKFPDAIIYNSKNARKEHEVFGFYRQSALVIPNGFDLDFWQPSPESGQSLRIALNIPQSVRVVGHIARFHPLKNHAGFLHAAVRVAATVKDVHFVLSGRDVVPSNASLIDLVPAAMRNRFHWLGDRLDIPDVLRSLDVLCQSSISEAFPNVLGEAMATSVPCIATNVGESATIVGDTGFVVEPANDIALADALSYMLSLPASKRRALGAAARARIAEKFSLSSIVDEYSNFYEQLAAMPLD